MEVPVRERASRLSAMTTGAGGERCALLQELARYLQGRRGVRVAAGIQVVI